MTEFGSLAKRLMDERGFTLRGLARKANYNPGHISRVLNNRKVPSSKFAEHLDTVLGARGELARAAAADRARERPAPKAPEQSIAVTDIKPLAMILAGFGAPPSGEPPQMTRLLEESSAVRLLYQACRYRELIGRLPVLLAALDAARPAADGDEQLRVHALAADAYHVAAGFMLKLGHDGLAQLAADRSMQAAAATGDPVTVGGSARIVTHALMHGGHLAAAVATASDQAARLDSATRSHDAGSLSVYGSLLLRGAIAAAEGEDRDCAATLLDEAGKAARRLGTEGNHRWTAFGPANAMIHQVCVAVTLGDAGTALSIAARIDTGTLTVTERRASLLTDMARAWLMRGKHQQAYETLAEAAAIAPEEAAARPTVRQFARDLAISSPPTVRRDARELASQIGVLL